MVSRFSVTVLTVTVLTVTVLTVTVLTVTVLTVTVLTVTVLTVTVLTVTVVTLTLLTLTVLTVTSLTLTLLTVTLLTVTLLTLTMLTGCAQKNTRMRCTRWCLKRLQCSSLTCTTSHSTPPRLCTSGTQTYGSSIRAPGDCTSEASFCSSLVARCLLTVEVKMRGGGSGGGEAVEVMEEGSGSKSDGRGGMGARSAVTYTALLPDSLSLPQNIFRNSTPVAFLQARDATSSPKLRIVTLGLLTDCCLHGLAGLVFSMAFQTKCPSSPCSHVAVEGRATGTGLSLI
ncbi:hypothetical protein FHG87_000518 [Trinorchestia longiramus]|nr:hypothetical protein FHG87_000518 [Trinorchestia longiramus]